MDKGCIRHSGRLLYGHTSRTEVGEINKGKLHCTYSQSILFSRILNPGKTETHQASCTGLQPYPYSQRSMYKFDFQHLAGASLLPSFSATQLNLSQMSLPSLLSLWHIPGASQVPLQQALEGVALVPLRYSVLPVASHLYPLSYG